MNPSGAEGASCARFAAEDEAVTLYRSAGYAEVAAFSADPYAHQWFERHIPETAQRS